MAGAKGSHIKKSTPTPTSTGTPIVGTPGTTPTQVIRQDKHRKGRFPAGEVTIVTDIVWYNHYQTFLLAIGETHE